MLLPTKYENLNNNVLILGAHTIRYIKKGVNNIEELFQKLKENHNIDLDLFFDVITFLWLADIIVYKNYSITLNK
ncbi:MAG: hypothetical protein QY331_01730 [Melioribacteraceae bacterium]|nr:MAG: hypothetical protein QY331_01730 [Melioribacteraceae bacterium]